MRGKQGYRWVSWFGRAGMVAALLFSGVLQAQALAWTADVVAVVNTTADVVAADGLCSLREAVNSLAEPQPGSDCPANINIIELAGLEYVLTSPVDEGNDPAGGDLDVRRPVTIRGAGRTGTVIDANRIDRVFEVSAAVRLENLTIQKGMPEWFGDMSRTDGGGGVYNRGTLTIDNVRFFWNVGEVYAGSSGGAIDNRGTLTISNSEFVDNDAYSGGGVITNTGTLTIRSSIFSGNNTYAGGGIRNGPAGVVLIEDSQFIGNRSVNDSIDLVGGGTITVRNTLFDCQNFPVETGGTIWTSGITKLEDVTIQNCIAYEYGGAITQNGGALDVVRSVIRQNYGGSGGGIHLIKGSLEVRDSLLVGNSAGPGGALYIEGGRALVANTTIVDNNAYQGAVTAAGGELDLDSVTIAGNTGAGLFAAEGQIQVHNSIVAGNFWEGLVQAGSECQASIEPIRSLGWNLIGQVEGCNFSSTNGDNLGSLAQPLDPLLGPLQDNGGPTWTRALLPGSPAVDDGDNFNCPVTDQRGMARPVDGNQNGNPSCDKGAFELQVNPVQETPTATLTATATETPTPTVTATETATVEPAISETPVVEPTQAGLLPPVLWVPIVGK